MDEKTLEILIKAEADIKAAFAETEVALHSLKDSAKDTQDAINDSRGGGLFGFLSGVSLQNALNGLNQLAAGLFNLLGKIPGIGAPFQAFATQLTKIASASPEAALGLAAVGAAILGVLLVPIVTLLPALGALTQALVGFATIAALFGGAMTVIAGTAFAVYELAKNTHAGAAAITAFGNAWDKAIGPLETLATPLLVQMLNWAQQFLPVIGQIGKTAIQSFGEDLPGVLRLVTPLMYAFFQVIQKDVMPAIGGLIDWVLAHRTQFIGFFEDLMKFGGSAFIWIVQQAENFAAWIFKNWPQIEGTLLKTWGNLKAAAGAFWFFVGPILTDIVSGLSDIGKHLENAKPIWVAFGAVAGAVLDGILGPLDLVIRGVQALLALLGQAQALANTKLTPPGRAPGALFPAAGGRFG